MKKSIIFLMLFGLILGFTGCSKTDTNPDLWEDALYTDNTELGNGNKTITVEVEVLDKSVAFTINTDKKTLGEALMEHNLIEGEQGSYGLYVKKVNGILADYDTTKSYWGLYKNGESMMTGVDQENISDKDNYKLVYTK